MTTVETTPDAKGANDAGARNPAGPILQAFDAIATKGGDPKAIASEQFHRQSIFVLTFIVVFELEQPAPVVAEFIAGCGSNFQFRTDKVPFGVTLSLLCILYRSLCESEGVLD